MKLRVLDDFGSIVPQAFDFIAGAKITFGSATVSGGTTQANVDESQSSIGSVEEHYFKLVDKSIVS